MPTTKAQIYQPYHQASLRLAYWRNRLHSHRTVLKGARKGACVEKMAVPEDNSKQGKAYNVLVRLALPPYTIHFKSSTYMREGTMEMLDKTVCKDSLRATAQKAEVR